MSSQKTTNYDLNQWLPDDSVLRTDFNADNAKIDAALQALADTAAGKADAGELSALTDTVAGQAAQIAQKGNCQIYTTTYTGTGTYGESAPNTLTFSAKPWLLAVINCSDGSIMIAVQGQPTSWNRASGAAWNNFTWSGNSVSWYSTSADSQQNNNGVKYQVVVFIKVA